jgi:hypothetical protein
MKTRSLTNLAPSELPSFPPKEMTAYSAAKQKAVMF